MPAWKKYQETAAQVFRDLGFVADTDVTVEGVRNNHDVDVLASYQHAGLDLTWIVECKFWEGRVSKDRVLTLRSIVEDVGADKGILLAERGFQSGAIQATYKSNVVLTSVADLRGEAEASLLQRRLLALPSRLGSAHDRYWDLPKSYREITGLRPDGAAPGYSGTNILRAVSSLIVSALADTLPPRDPLVPDRPIHTRERAADVAELLLAHLEEKLAAAETNVPTNVKSEVEAGQASRSKIDAQPLDEVKLQFGIDLLLGVPLTMRTAASGSRTSVEGVQ